MIPLIENITKEVIRNYRLVDDEAGRLFHGRGGCFPGLEELCIDVYPPVGVISIFNDLPWAPALPRALDPCFAEPPKTWLLQDRTTRQTRWSLLAGEPVDKLLTQEEGLVFEIKLMAHSNLGLFLDMKPGRQLVRSLAQGKRVLNLFAYTCAFSVAALAGGAVRVDNMDTSKSALASGRGNHRHNAQDLSKVRFLPHDVMRSIGRMKRHGPYDLIIIDPPSRQERSFHLERDYPKLVRRLPEILSADAHVIACLNAPYLDAAWLDSLFTDTRFTLVHRLGRPTTFPERDPDKGLKIHNYRFWDDQEYLKIR